MQCWSCERTVDDATTCPHCGYAPRRILLVNGVAYHLLSGVLTVSVLAWFFLSGSRLLLVAFLGILVGGATGLHGVNLYAGGLLGDVEEDLSEYSLLVYRGGH